jgi:uric acid transporter
MPQVLRPIVTDPIMMTSITAVALNAYFNRTSGASASQDAMRAAQQAETL